MLIVKFMGKFLLQFWFNFNNFIFIKKEQFLRKKDIEKI